MEEAEKKLHRKATEMKKNLCYEISIEDIVEKLKALDKNEETEHRAMMPKHGDPKPRQTQTE